jgi:ABC-type nickel/cobalt efflux system permease component RcnA
VPRDNHDRTLVVRLTSEKVIVEYRLELDESRAARDLPREELAKVFDVKEFYTAFTRFHAPVLANNLFATLDGDNAKPLEFKCVRQAYQVLDHLRCDYRFEASWKPEPGQRHTFRLRDGNYEDDDFSRLHLALSAGPSLTLWTVDAPDETLMARLPSDRKPGDGERLRKVAATFEVAPVEPKGTYKPALPPDVDAPRAPPLPESPAGAATQMRGPEGEAAVSKLTGPEPQPSADSVAEVIEEGPTPSSPRSLEQLLFTNRGVWLLLSLAAIFGAAHALTPGHGKTLVAAYLVGERGTVWHAILLGVVTTLTHTAAVLVLAGLLPLFFPKHVSDSAQQALGLICGLLVVGVGFWVLLRRLSGRADHVHFGGHGHGHGHHHGHSHAHNHGGADHTHDAEGRVIPRAVDWWSLVVLGMTGGIVPCPEAIALLGTAIKRQQVWLGLPLLLAFSAGLASVLIAIGIGVVCVRGFADVRWSENKRLRAVIRALPLVSAVLVTGLGLWMCYDSVHH